MLLLLVALSSQAAADSPSVPPAPPPTTEAQVAAPALAADAQATSPAAATDAPSGAKATASDARTAPAASGADSTATTTSAVVSARQAYQAAWAQRQGGDYDGAARTAAAALVRVSEALAANPDLAVRVELNELQSRLSGLRNASARDSSAEAAAERSGNEPTDKVLNAPARDEIEPQINGQVLRCIEFFTGTGRSTFERWLKRSGRYMELFRQALRKEGLPPDLVHLVFVESGFNLNARSVSAAVGPWQFLRSTARLFGLTVNQWVDERRDPEKSTVAAARYLKHLYSIFGDWPLALAAYNAGEGTVLRAVKRQGTTNYWDLRLPRQTEDYVPQFMAILAISRNPEKYGFDAVALDDPMEFDEVALKGAVDLRSVARLADCTYDELKQLNPAVLHHAASGAGGVTTLRVPRGKGEILMQKLQQGATLPAADLTLRHRVRRGETLQRIARTYHVSARQLALANGIGRRHPLRRGMMLTVPASLDAPAPALLEANDPRGSTAYVPGRRIAPPQMVQGNSNAEGRVIHTVRRGETLQAIAARYGVSVEDLRRWNRLTSVHVRRGTRLKIRTGDAAVEARSEWIGPPSTTDPPSAPSSPGATEPAKHTEENEAGAGTSEASPADKDTDPPAVRETPARPRDSRRTSTRATASGARQSLRTVVVRRGTTLSEIAYRHHVSVERLMRLNGLTTARVRAGQRIKLPIG